MFARVRIRFRTLGQYSSNAVISKSNSDVTEIVNCVDSTPTVISVHPTAEGEQRGSVSSIPFEIDRKSPNFADVWRYKST